MVHARHAGGHGDVDVRGVQQPVDGGPHHGPGVHYNLVVAPCHGVGWLVVQVVQDVDPLHFLPACGGAGLGGGGGRGPGDGGGEDDVLEHVAAARPVFQLQLRQQLRPAERHKEPRR